MLKLKNSIFGNTLSIYLNNALYSFTKFNDILTSYNTLHSILSSGEFSFPTLNVDVNSTDLPMSNLQSPQIKLYYRTYQ